MEDCNMRQIGSGGGGLWKEVEWIWFHYRALKYFSCFSPRKCDVAEEASASRWASCMQSEDDGRRSDCRCQCAGLPSCREQHWDSSDKDQGGGEHRGKSERGKERRRSRRAWAPPVNKLGLETESRDRV